MDRRGGRDAKDNEVRRVKLKDDVLATDDAAVVSSAAPVRVRSWRAIFPVDVDAASTPMTNVHVNAVQAQRLPVRTKQSPVRLHAALLTVFVSVCLAWLLWVLALTVGPTMIMNSVMNTEDFDDGSFWLMTEPPTAIVVIGVAGLGCVAVGYLGLVSAVVVLLERGNTAQSRGPRLASERSVDKVTDLNVQHPNSRTESIKRAAKQAAMEITNRESKTRRTMALAAKTAEIFVQCVVLAQLLEDGMPVGLCGLFAAIVILNALTSSIFCLLPYDNMGLVHAFTDTAFDFVVAVAFPIIEVIYAKNLFTFNRPLLEISQRIFPLGFFERVELVVADPVEVEVIRHVIDSLRIDSLLKIFTRVSPNVSLLLRCTRLVELLRAKQAGITKHRNEYAKNSRIAASLFALTAICVVLWTEESIRTSQNACGMHSECVQHAHKWIIGRDEDDFTRCACIAIIDRDLTLASYDDWVQPPDRTQKVANLATPGYLQTLQLVNRGLVSLPDQVRGCRDLKHVSLYYTNTETLPNWFGELTKLQFLHIEGKELGPYSQASLRSLPTNMFDKMHSLMYLHLALHKLRTLPSFDGLINVNAITLVILFKLEAVPSFDNLRNLKRILVSCTPTVRTFPQLDNIRQLDSLIVYDRGGFCCNGFLGEDRCNLTHPLCTFNYFSNEPAITECVSKDNVASPTTRSMFAKFRASTCVEEALAPGMIDMPPARADMEQCNGIMYRQCVIPGYGVGMCYNPRWMAVSCFPSPFAIQMRREQIAQKIGTPCNPEYEAWLGC